MSFKFLRKMLMRPASQICIASTYVHARENPDIVKYPVANTEFYFQVAMNHRDPRGKPMATNCPCAELAQMFLQRFRIKCRPNLTIFVQISPYYQKICWNCAVQSGNKCFRSVDVVVQVPPLTRLSPLPRRRLPSALGSVWKG